jgi:aminoglycoside phosphotransferase (APT) family kinase protein
MDATRLQAFLTAVEPERSPTVKSAEPIPGGYSRDTVIAEVEWADGSSEKLVLRGDPEIDGSVFRSDRDREWTLLRALADVPDFRIARPRYYDQTGQYLGTKCIVSEAIPTTSMQAFLETGPDLLKAREDFIGIIASIHTTPLDHLGDTIARPDDWDAHIDAIMGIYDRILQKVEASGDSDPVLRYVRKKMRSNRPPEVPLTLVHGDCQPGNFLLPADGEPVIIDWEFGHIGDPRQDLGYYLQIPMPPHLYHPDPEAFLSSYRRLTGLTEEQVNPQVVRYFMLLGMAHLLEQMMDAAEAVAKGEHRGILGPYLLGSITHFRKLFLGVCLTLPDAPEVAR